MRDDIFKKLTFGIKKTQRQVTKDDEEDGAFAALRLRVLPENIKEELRKLKRKLKGEKIHRENAKNDEDDGGIKLLSEGGSVGGHGNQSDSENDVNNSIEVKRKIAEMVNQLRRLNRIYTWGDDIPDPFIGFFELDLPEALLCSLKEFGIEAPTPIQMQAIPLMAEHRDVLASAPTGSGKTLAFAIPIIMDVLRLKKLDKYKDSSRLLAIVLEPTRELAAQTYRQFLKFSQDLPVTAALFDSEELPRNIDVLVSTPNRLTHHLKDMKLKCLRCKENLNNVAMVCIGERNSANSNVVQELVFAGSEHGKLLAVRTLLQTQFDPPALIFVQSKERARELLSALSSLTPPIPAAFISSEKSQSERDHIVESFRSGRLWVLICTELMGRGLDLRNVNLVINFDLPTSIVSYIHRIGRTGRAGRKGRAITYFTEADTKYLRSIATVIHQAGFEVPEYTLSLKPLSRNQKKELVRHAPKRKHIAFIKKKSVKTKDSKDAEGPPVKRAKINKSASAPKSKSGDSVEKKSGGARIENERDKKMSKVGKAENKSPVVPSKIKLRKRGSAKKLKKLNM
ncbi:helicase protein [Necator americanus]|uniref:RNA helicase n=1 Tax=Necator americanus TaxID=51031 RepID=W2TYM0_NECAM|nr:helicase protein [Necator americanus]ETN86127.1 helicase protein [Necator americanus]